MDRPEHDRIPEIAREWHLSGKGACLASVVETWGSAPRPTGAQLAVSGTGDMMGSVSGGCVEGAVIEESLAALEDGQSRLLTFGVSDEDAFAVGLACGGTIRVLVEPVGPALPPEMLDEIVAARAARRPLAYSVNLSTWERGLTGPEGPHAARFRSDKSGVDEVAGGEVFTAIHNPPLRMIVVGAVHIAQPLLAMARACGHDPVLIDPREAFGSASRFPGEEIRHDWPDEAMAEIGLDARTAVVTLTHDPKLDDPAIVAALAAPVYYLGCLGSTRTHAKRVARLTEAGFSQAQIGRIHAPVGLDIGAKSPAEIAVAIMAQIVQTLRRG